MIFYSIVLLSIYCFAALSLGGALLWLLGRKSGLGDVRSSIAGPVTSFLLGAGILTNAWLVISLLPGGRLTPVVIALVLAGSLLVGFSRAWRELAGFCSQLGRALSRVFREKHWAWKIIVIATLAMAVLYGLTSTLPPKGDAAAFYMSLPKLISHTHQLLPMPAGYEDFSQIGLHGEMHFAALISLGSDQSATMLVFVMALACAAMLLSLAGLAKLGGLGKWIVLAMVFTSPALTRVIPGGKVDLFGSAMGLSAVYWAMKITDSRTGGIRWLAVSLAGVFTGFAVVAKITLLGSVVPMVALLAIWRVVLARQGRRKKTSRPGRGVILPVMGCCACLLFWASLAVVPHLIKNGVLFGQPFAPFYPGNGNWLRQEWITPATARHLLHIYPLALYMGLFPGMYGAMSALGLAFFPLAMLIPKPKFKQFLRSNLTQLTIVALLATLTWAVMQTSVFALRYFLPPLLLLLLLPARAAELCWTTEAGRAGRLIRTGIVICLIMALTATFNRPKGHPGKALGYITGKYSVSDVGDVCARQAGVINSLAEAGQRVFVATPYTYFLRPDLLARVSGKQDYLALEALPTDPSRWEYLYDKGFRFVMVSPQRSKPAKDGKNCEIIHGFHLSTTRLSKGLKLDPVFIEYGETGPPRPIYVVYRLDR